MIQPRTLLNHGYGIASQSFFGQVTLLLGRLALLALVYAMQLFHQTSSMELPNLLHRQWKNPEMI